MPNSTGLCKCGCGQLTPIAKATNRRRGYVRGEPTDYIHGHSSRTQQRTWDPADGLPLCACGCGLPVTLSKVTDSTRGRVRGQPNLFRRGHWNRPALTYREEDRGFETPCHIWEGQIDKLGYARWERPGMPTVLVHRQVWIAANGDPGAGWEAHHRCEQRDCVRLDHLELRRRGTHQRWHRGVSPEKYEAICEAIRSGEETQAAIARRFGVTKQYIWSLRRWLLST